MHADTGKRWCHCQPLIIAQQRLLRLMVCQVAVYSISTLNRFVVAEIHITMSIGSFTVTVTVDGKPASYRRYPPTIVNNVGSNCGNQVINYSLPTSTDNALQIGTHDDIRPASGSVFPVGTTTVTYLGHRQCQ